jgi:hypothetical protein
MMGLKRQITHKFDKQKEIQCLVERNPPTKKMSNCRSYFKKINSRDRFSSYSKKRIKSYTQRSNQVNKLMVQELEGGTKVKSYNSLVGIKKKK